MNTTITGVTALYIKELIEEGWEFSLHYGDEGQYCDLAGPCWCADFTRKLPDTEAMANGNGIWDNHESGYSYDIREAVKKAYYNIKNGIKLNLNRFTKQRVDELEKFPDIQFPRVNNIVPVLASSLDDVPEAKPGRSQSFYLDADGNIDEDWHRKNK